MQLLVPAEHPSQDVVALFHSAAPDILREVSGPEVGEAEANPADEVMEKHGQPDVVLDGES